jgi:hypothetical protein
MRFLMVFAFAAAIAAQVPVVVEVKPVPIAPVEPTPYGVWVHAEAPLAGHCWIWTTLPADAPEVLVGPSGIVAYRVARLGSEISAYGIETFAELLEPMRVSFAPAPGAGLQLVAIPLREMHASDRVPGFAPHPAVLEQLAGIVPKITLGDRTLAAPAMEFAGQDVGAQWWTCTWDDMELPVIGWVRVRARSPIVDLWLVARSRDAAPRRVDLRIDSTQEMILEADGLRTVVAGDVVGELVLDFAALDIVRAQIAVRRRDAEVEGDEAAIAAARHGHCFGLAERWNSSRWLVAPVVHGSPAIADQVQAWITRQLAGELVRPWMARANPNAGGTDPGMGLTWSAPIWPQGRRADPRVVRLVTRSADSWAWRPSHWFEAAAAFNLIESPPAHPKLTIHTQQPWRSDPDTLGLTLPTSRKAPLRGLEPHDVEHRFAGPLAAGLALAADPALRLVAQSWIAAELHERSGKLGWVQNGRAEGRVIATLLMLERVTGFRSAEVRDYVAGRLARVRTTSPGGRVPHDRPVHVCRLSDRGEPWPYWVPYEEGQFAWAAWLAGDVELARLHGRTVAVGCVFDGVGQLNVGYHVRYLTGADEGLALGPPGQPHVDIKPGGAALAQWAGAGLHAYLLADAVLRDRGVVSGPDPYLDVARRALAVLDAQIASIGLSEATVARHTSLTGAFPEHTIPKVVR